MEVAPGIRIEELASSLGVNSNIIAAKVDGVPVDLDRPLSRDCAVDWIPIDSRDGVDILRHSTAHLMAQAVQSLFPGTQVTIGPTTEDGFYYDFKRDRSFTPEEIAKIEALMRELAAKDLKIAREELPREKAIELFRKMGEDYKVEILSEIPEETVSLYRQGDWVDLCRGPHLPSTGIIRAFKLTRIAGAYWRGDERNEMLQRIYGTSFPSEEQLREHLELLEEAKKRDHRKLGAELGLFMLADEVGAGLPLWLPNGATIRRILERWIVDLELAAGYQHVYTPELAKVDLYRKSGHWDKFHNFMFPVMERDKEHLVLRPMNCPHHILIYKAGKHSYRELPILIAELGTMYRYEKSGELSGLSRVRAMTLNDAHVFCRPEQVKKQFKGVLNLILKAYRALGFSSYWHRLSLHDPRQPEKYHSNEAMWQFTERVLKEAMDEMGLPYIEAPGEAAFYGPKLDVQVRSVVRKEETISTIQIDNYLPERFDLEFIAEDGKSHRPTIIHRALISTFERLVAYLIENYNGAFPLWLSAVQIRVMTVTDQQRDYAEKIFEELKKGGWRVELDGRNEKLGYKIREAQLAKIPFALIIGDREIKEDRVSPRRRGGETLEAMSLERFMELLRAEVAGELGESQ